MKKLHFLIIIILFSSIILFADGVQPNGSGTETDPYQVETLDNLLWISTNNTSWDSYFIQTADIDATDTQNWNGGEGFSPIGTGFYDYFTGCYNGQDHIIDGLYINRPVDYQGLFGYTNDNATISNLGVTNASLSGGENVGSLVGYSWLTAVINCYSTGNVNGSHYVGGLIGYARNSTITSSYSENNITGTSRVGGFVGESKGSITSNCYSIGNVSGNYHIGGFTGEGDNAAFTSCYSIGDVYAIEWGMGGFIGVNYSNNINNSFYNYETVSINGEHILHFCALNDDMFSDWLDNDLALNIDDYLTSNGDNFLINNVDDLKKLLFFGQFNHHFILTNDLDLSSSPGFFIPHFKGIFDGNNHIIENVDINLNTFWGNSFRRIGLFGYVIESFIVNLGSVNVNLCGTRFAGGLVGYCRDSIIERSYSTGNMYDSIYAGGLVGYNEYSSIYNSYSKCNVTGNTRIGGLVGSNDQSDIDKSYSVGYVNGNGSEYAGGLVGAGFQSEVTNSFWDFETSNQTSSAGGTLKTTAAMKDIATYTDESTAGLTNAWDFVGNPFDDIGNEDYWNINEEINNGYPHFNWQFMSDFFADQTVVLIGFEILFTDISSGNPNTWEWDFDNDGIIDSSEQNPIYSFTEPGTYTVSLTTSDGINTDTETKIDYITVGDQLISDFSADPTSGISPLAVQFTDLSVARQLDSSFMVYSAKDLQRNNENTSRDIISWDWDFDNDGNIDSNEQNPIHSYTEIGIYTVSLTISDGTNYDTRTKVDYIAVNETEIEVEIISINTKLYDNYPNPFNPSTTIEFSIQNDSKINLTIFNIKGQKIKNLVNNEVTRGNHSFIWNGDDEIGKSVGSGIYYYKLSINGKSEAVKKCLLLK